MDQDNLPIQWFNYLFYVILLSTWGQVLLYAQTEEVKLFRQPRSGLARNIVVLLTGLCISNCGHLGDGSVGIDLKKRGF